MAPELLPHRARIPKTYFRKGVLISKLHIDLNTEGLYRKSLSLINRSPTKCFLHQPRSFRLTNSTTDQQPEHEPSRKQKQAQHKTPYLI